MIASFSTGCSLKENQTFFSGSIASNPKVDVEGPIENPPPVGGGDEVAPVQSRTLEFHAEFDEVKEATNVLFAANTALNNVNVQPKLVQGLNALAGELKNYNVSFSVCSLNKTGYIDQLREYSANENFSPLFANENAARKSNQEYHARQIFRWQDLVVQNMSFADYFQQGAQHPALTKIYTAMQSLGQEVDNYSNCAHQILSSQLKLAYQGKPLTLITTSFSDIGAPNIGYNLEKNLRSTISKYSVPEGSQLQIFYDRNGNNHGPNWMYRKYIRAFVKVNEISPTGGIQQSFKKLDYSCEFTYDFEKAGDNMDDPNSWDVRQNKALCFIPKVDGAYRITSDVVQKVIEPGTCSPEMLDALQTTFLRYGNSTTNKVLECTYDRLVTGTTNSNGMEGSMPAITTKRTYHLALVKGDDASAGLIKCDSPVTVYKRVADGKFHLNTASKFAETKFKQVEEKYATVQDYLNSLAAGITNRSGYNLKYACIETKLLNNRRSYDNSDVSNQYLSRERHTSIYTLMGAKLPQNPVEMETTGYYLSPYEMYKSIVRHLGVSKINASFIYNKDPKNIYNDGGGFSNGIRSVFGGQYKKMIDALKKDINEGGIPNPSAEHPNARIPGNSVVEINYSDTAWEEPLKALAVTIKNSLRAVYKVEARAGENLGQVWIKSKSSDKFKLLKSVFSQAAPTLDFNPVAETSLLNLGVTPDELKQFDLDKIRVELVH